MVSAGPDPLPQEQGGDAEAEDQGHGLAGKFAWPQPYQKLLVFLEGHLKEDYTITSLPLQIQAIKMMWVKGLPLAYFQKLARSMPRHIKVVMATKGQITKY